MAKFKFEKPKTVPDWIDIVFKCLMIAISITYFVFLIAGGYMFGANSEFYRSLNLFSGAGDPNIAIRITSYFLFILVVAFISSHVLRFVSKFLKKGGAILNLLASLIKYVGAIVFIFLVLDAFHVDTMTLLVSAGVVSLVIGLGAQSLISDVIAGLFIVFEEIFEIGDIIVVDGFRGTVKEIGIRTTQIVDWGGNIKVINNSDLRSLVNMTAQMSTAMVVVDIEYGESLERVENVIKNNLERMKNNIPAIKDGPYYVGVSELGASGVSLKFIAQCKETVRFQTERDMLRELKLIFDENDVGIPFNQVTINQPKEFQKVTKKEKVIAQEFVKEQQEQSKDIPTEPNETH